MRQRMQQRSKPLESQIGAPPRGVLQASSWLWIAMGSLCLLVQGRDGYQLRGLAREPFQQPEAEISPVASEPAEPLPTFARNILGAHNSIRAKLRLPLLVWSSRQAQSAQAWADTLIATGKFSIRGSGQNLAESKPAGSLTEQDVVSLWAAEAKYYHPATNTCSARCGHYTQMVWRDTTMVGCGVAKDGTRAVWVCDYAPPGNILGERPY